MAGMAAAGVAHSGVRPTPTPHCNIFDFVFSRPFQQASDLVSASQTVPRIDDAHPIYVDNKTSALGPNRRAIVSSHPLTDSCSQTLRSPMAVFEETLSPWPPTCASWV